MKNRPYLIALAVTVALLGLIVVYVQEFSVFNRTLHSSRLAVGGLIAGVILGAVLGYRFSRQANDVTERLQVYVFCIVLSALFMPLWASLTNRWFPRQRARPVPVEFIEEQARYVDRFGPIKGEQPKPNRYVSFFYYQGKLYRIQTDTPRFAGHERGDTVLVGMKRGLWGAEVVE